ncbi:MULTISPECIES: MetQ/NlpA family ABC transporter substrate-binding protein [Brevibacillus]|jgi:ABC-type metal ion transport system, periplasmic component/surface antigen|uniref:Lipoprotein n=1 Tax=Brevibacillus parabrevis TaxID=54914 RepID=A0A4Y3PR71_BREPA|nr:MULTISPECIES: MetQ/NlpA family ABC transporter substrate-binding protein [Brevibacillus]MBU8711092.1 MetQ/NlpA family ABC transporter substrate-binding protein [Brevibacillus parabrevis]MDH6350240.1 D-methionine transport system substrate-binding protein [Brevibacillus sp. 1238]MDR4999678.1 MetQ/NlpA family ABC transporter substrate-binding protein [Brevibacillus parabrevis]MED2253758.1 MetQ/NlpA family ABC transporter substrate-binding protein [Brevibacillus parabrevis]NRQ53907.1 ABC trans
MRKKGLGVIFSVLVAFSMVAAGCGSGSGSGASGSQSSSSAPAAPAQSGSGQAAEPAKEVTLKVGAAPVPHAEILEFVKPKLKEQGVNLEVVVLDDEGQLNPALQDKQIDANFFQHVPYLDSIKTEKGYDFAVTTKVHVEPIGFYSDKLKSKDEIQEGAKIGIPNNPSNEYRALILLQEQGWIKLKDGLTTYQATPKDIAENPKKLEFIEAEASTLPRVLPDLAGAVINTNVVLEAKIDPKSALFREGANSPYANVITVRKGDENRDEIKKLDAVLTSPEVKKFIEDKYGVAVVPAF